jgi:uncharacterized protein (DUF1697 family)
VRYAALLRGINLGSHKRIAMADLRDLFADLGAAEVSTYLQSGNVVFESKTSAKTLAAKAERAIATSLGLEVAVLVRSRTELAKIVAGNPFGKRDESKLYLTLLARAPSAARIRALDPHANAPDEFRVVGRDVFLHFPGGYGRSKLSNAYFEKHLSVVATTRNWRTVTALAELTAA